MRYLVNKFFRAEMSQRAEFPAARELLFRRERAPFQRCAPCVRALILTNKYGIFPIIRTKTKNVSSTRD